MRCFRKVGLARRRRPIFAEGLPDTGRYSHTCRRGCRRSGGSEGGGRQSRNRRGSAHRKPNGGMTSVSSHLRGGAALVLLVLLRHSVQSVDLLLAADRGLELAAHIRRFAPEVWAPTEHRPLGTMRDAERTIGAKAPGSSGARPPPPILAPLLCKTLPHQRKDRFAYSVITLIAMNFLKNERK